MLCRFLLNDESMILFLRCRMQCYAALTYTTAVLVFVLPKSFVY